MPLQDPLRAQGAPLRAVVLPLFFGLRAFLSPRVGLLRSRLREGGDQVKNAEFFHDVNLIFANFLKENRNIHGFLIAKTPVLVYNEMRIVRTGIPARSKDCFYA